MSINTPTMLMMMQILRYMPARCVSLVCCAGSLGYRALKEMLESGVPGNTLLIESEDLLTLPGANTDDGENGLLCGTSNTPGVKDDAIQCQAVDNRDIVEQNNLSGCCCLVYTFHPTEEAYYEDPDTYDDHLPTSTTHVNIFTDMTTLPASLLTFCKHLTAITICDSHPSNHHHRITAVKSSFLKRCRGLKELDLAPLSQITAAPGSFLLGCSSLTTINLQPLSHITTIGNYFLCDCSGLTSIDLGPLTNVVQLGGSFMKGCKALTTIDLTPLSQITVVNTSMLAECEGLTSINLGGLTQVTTIHNMFLSECSSLTSIDLSPLSQVTDIQRFFLNGCTGLKSIDISPLSNVISIRDYFLFECSGLSTIDMSGLSMLQVVPSDLLTRFEKPTSSSTDDTATTATTTLILPPHIMMQ